MKKLVMVVSKSSWTSGKLLAQALGCRIISWRNSKFRYRPNRHLILNYGSTTFPEPLFGHLRINIINAPLCIYNATNKLTTLHLLRINEVPIPDFTTDEIVAMNWAEDGYHVYCRTLLSSYGGRGIVVSTPGDPSTVVDAPLYTKGIGKCREYRAHVVNGEVIHIAQKRKRNGGEQTGLIKNKDNNWIFSTQNMYPVPEDFEDIAKRAVDVLGLDFGAVDIAVRHGSCYVLEVNTAPGLQGITLQKYVEAFKKLREIM